MNVGERIQELRRQLGMSGNALAKKCGIGQSSISDLENGKVSPSVETLERICGGLGISLADFFAEQREELPIDIQALLGTVQELSPSQRATLHAFLDSIVNSNNRINGKKEVSDISANKSIPTVRQVAAHFEGEYGVYDEELASHVVERIKRSQANYDRRKGNTDKRG